MTPRVTIVGGGLAGCEAAWQLARRGVSVELLEMRPLRTTPVHHSDDLAELVCSNSFRGNALDQAAGLLKEEMRRMDSLVVRVADSVKVPAGSALAVDRALFARRVTEAIESLPGVRIHRQEAPRIPEDKVTIVATGPLTSPSLAEDVASFVGRAHLYFFDAVSPVIEADTIDLGRVFPASRYGKGGDDYLNCPLDEEEYRSFHAALTAAECACLHDFEKELFFEGCLPVEVIASRGLETLRFGPMKPVGLVDPRTGRRPWAVVQLRQDDLAASHYSMVGFQTQLKWGEQKRVFRMIPGLEGAEFVRHGMIHRNTYVNAPLTLEPSFETRRRRGLFFAGQMSGVEGYVESAGSGLVAGLGAFFRSLDREPLPFPEDTALGALGRYIARSDPAGYQPTNVAFGLLPELPQPVPDRARRRRALAQRALLSLERFRARLRLEGGLQAEAAASTG
ncbi:MAG: methylenetetrahydrofolate--tRNA-(uracil(54)-C(5))-methyltransferase (FADH(2)-oxidizing) TrmFO [Acidobacteria bacterium RBG_16_70_10]|nr:MAG: methylenetetrahydrofolate--tRNA-(uracil(54)-C(5))-methyltransferase (FADH(2)-oxidizing) TrmFO [Acidobacteria bacterium RBG_16_70_10]